MRFLSNTITFFFLCVSCAVVAREEVSQSVDMNFTVDIIPPVCKLSNAEQSIEFGDFSVQDVIKNSVRGRTTFIFTDCVSVDSLTVSFSGSSVDSYNNYIKNGTGDGYASGIGIKLYDDNNNEISLGQGYTKPVGKEQNSLSLLIDAVVVKEGKDTKIKSGIVDTAVTLNVVYN